MKLRSLLIPLVALALASAAMANDTPKPAAEVLAGSYAKAKAEKKNVFLIFHASWCGWCKRMDAFMEMKEFKPIFDKYYVITHLDVLEQPDKKNLENPGAIDVLTKLGGEKAGLPYFAILDPEEKVVVDSLREVDGKKGDPTKNTGHPMAPEEVAWFMEMLKRSSKMTAEETKAIHDFLKSQKG